MKKIIVLFIVVFLNYVCYSQKERGNLIDIRGGTDLIRTLNNTNWELKKILEKKGIFKIKRKVRKEEELELSFKDTIAVYFYKDVNKTISCRYRPSSKDKSDYEHLTVECESCNYYWTVYRLSKQKLVIHMSLDSYKNLDMKDIGRYIFYRKK